LDTLSTEYASADPKFQTKIQNLKKKYVSIRRVRRDGNCFYRAFGFALLEHLLQTGDQKDALRLEKLIHDVLPKMINIGGYPELTLEFFHETTLEQFQNLTSGQLTLDNLLESFRDFSTSNSIVTFLRLLTGTSLKENADVYAPFLLVDHLTIDSFCASEVEPMAKEADHCQIEALASRALGCILGVEYLDLSTGENCNYHLFSSSSSPTGSEVETQKQTPIALLYRPGHYDILYSS